MRISLILGVDDTDTNVVLDIPVSLSTAEATFNALRHARRPGSAEGGTLILCDANGKPLRTARIGR